MIERLSSVSGIRALPVPTMPAYAIPVNVGNLTTSQPPIGVFSVRSAKAVDRRWPEFRTAFSSGWASECRMLSASSIRSVGRAVTPILRKMDAVVVDPTMSALGVKAGEQLQKRGLAAVRPRALDGQARRDVDLQVNAVDGVGENAPQDHGPQEYLVGADIAADLVDNRVQHGGNVGDRVRPRRLVRALKRAFLLRPGNTHGDTGVALFLQGTDLPADQLCDAFPAPLPCDAVEIAGLIDDQVDGAFRQAEGFRRCLVKQLLHQVWSWR